MSEEVEEARGIAGRGETSEGECWLAFALLRWQPCVRENGARKNEIIAMVNYSKYIGTRMKNVDVKNNRSTVWGLVCQRDSNKSCNNANSQLVIK